MNATAAKDSQRGFALIELVIAMGMMLVLFGSIMVLMKDGLRVGNTTYEMTDAQESLRSAHEYISRDLVVAGDGLRGINNIRVPLGFVTNYLSQTPIEDPKAPGYVDLSILTSDDDVPAGTAVLNTAPAVTVRSNPSTTDRLTVVESDRTFTTIGLPATAINGSGSNIVVSPADIGKFSIGEIYFITSEQGAAFGTITNITGAAGATPNLVFSTGDTYGLNRAVLNGPISFVSAKGTLPTSLMRMQIVHYFVNSNGLLIRRVFGVKGAGFSDSVMAEHVTNMQFRYALSLPDANGFVQQPIRRLATSEQQVSVRQVEVTISTETVHFVNNQTVNGKLNASRQNLTMTTSTSVRNLQFRQALQPTSDDPSLSGN
jgi:type II secretory pathway pseudopilin PulG